MSKESLSAGAYWIVTFLVFSLTLIVFLNVLIIFLFLIKKAKLF